MALTIAAILVGWTSYQLNWIQQRRDLRAEGAAILNYMGNYTTGVTSDDIAPTGSTLPQRLLALFGEPAESQVFVYYILAEPDHLERDGYLYPLEATDYAKVQRAQRLFPEAKIIAVFIEPRLIKQFKDDWPELENMISE